MLIARVKVQTTDAGHQTVVETLTAEEGRIASLFEGCEQYLVSSSTSDPNTVIITEEWTTKEHFDTYTSSEHFAETMAAVGPCLAGPPDSAYYVGALVGP